MGGDCIKLLRNVDTLASICPIQVLPYVKCFRLFLIVVNGCFSDSLSSTISADIKMFKDAYMALEISITPKLHILFDHIPQFCAEHNRGLSLYSEQASESVHSIFKLCWQKRLVKMMSNPRYASALLDTVVEFNSKHV